MCFHYHCCFYFMCIWQDGAAPDPPGDESGDESSVEREDDQIKCVIFHQNKKYKVYLSTNDGVIEDNSEVFQDFCDFLEETFEIDCIDIDDWPENLQLFSIENVDDIDNEENQIECGDDFGDVFENFDNDSDDPKNYTFYFVFKTDNDDDETYGSDEKKNEKNERV